MDLRLENIFNHDDFVSFHAVMESTSKLNPKCYNYIGINFQSGQIVSLKFYYTFFEFDYKDNVFPIPILEERFRFFESKTSNYHLNTKNIPGCGLTFSIKFDLVGNVSKGVYFRIKNSAIPYIKKVLGNLNISITDYGNHFDIESYLKYLAIEGDGTFVDRNYIYGKRNDYFNLFDVESGINFSKSEYLEISSDLDSDFKGENIRLIALNSVPLVNDETKFETNEIIKILGSKVLLDSGLFKLHGYYVHKKVKSVFIFGNEKYQSGLISAIKNEIIMLG